jgi:Cd2+/Zn2+-exporting ATPase
MSGHGHRHQLDGLSSSEIQSETNSLSLGLIGTLMGGALLINSLIADYFFKSHFVHAEIMAMIGAALLSLPVIIHALKDLFGGHSHMDELVALAIVACFATGLYTEAGAIAFFMLIAELIEARTAMGARASIEALVRYTPNVACLVADGNENEIEVALLKKGNIVRVRPGDNMPVDGVVISGHSTVNQAAITGESVPIDVKKGDKIFAGTTNLTGAVDIEVTQAGSDTTLGKVKTLIEEAESTRIPLMRIIDKYIHWYIPTILMIAVIAIYLNDDLHAALSVLVISCPCALILATPTAMVASLSSAARLGVLVKNVQELESAAKINAIVFDKTGTLTTGNLGVTKLSPIKGVDAADMLYLAGSAEQFSKHPAAKAVIKVATQAQLTLAEPKDFAEVPGRGVTGVVDGAQVKVGRETWLTSEGVDMSQVNVEGMQPPEGISLLYIAKDNRCIGWIGMEDQTRSEASAAVKALDALGVKRMVMVTGDRLAVAKRVAAEMGCSEVKAECLPHEKLNLVHQLQAEKYHVAVVGDGVNDAPALAAGNIGIAMGAFGSDVAIHSASIALMNNNLQRLPFLIKLSRTTRSVVTQNLVLGVLFIVIGVICSVMNYIPPALAAALHLLSSMVIVCNSARLVRFGEEIGQSEAMVADDSGNGSVGAIDVPFANVSPA